MIGPLPPTTATVNRLVVIQAVLLLGLHLFAAIAARDPRMPVPHALAWLHDLLVLVAIAAPAWAVGRRTATWAEAIRLTAGGGVVAVSMPLALAPALLASFLMSPANLFTSDLGSAKVFVDDYLGWSGLWPAGLALVTGIAGWRTWEWRCGRKSGIAGAVLLVPAILTLGMDSPNALVFGLQDSLRQAFVPRHVARLTTTPDGTAQLDAAPTPVWPTSVVTARYDRVAVVVLETVTTKDFDEIFLRSDGFFARQRHQTRVFTRHLTTNQDSYTALVAMTVGIQVPFRAYAAPERYAAVNDAPNMVRSLRDIGFISMFVSTYEHQPFVPVRADWDRVLDRRDLGDLSTWTSLGSQRMEAATDDRVALSTLVGFLAESPGRMVMAELVYGHSPAWQARFGLTPTAYADLYLTQLWDDLTSKGMTDRMLLVVVADHGHRSRTGEPDNYRVPLVVIGAGVPPGEDRSLRSHLDVPGIIAHFLGGGPLPPPRESVLVVGSTERWIYGMFRADGTSALIDDGSGRMLSGTLDPAEVRRAFQGQVQAFTARFGSRPAGSGVAP